MLKARVRRKAQETEGICSLDLEAADGQPLPEFRAGAHIDVHLPGGFVRQYSLWGSSADRMRYRIAVLLEPQSRGGSRAVHVSVHENDVLTISPPRNHFPLHPAGESILIGGGIGITPLLCMAEELATDSRPYELHYCVRSAARAAFRERLVTPPLAANVSVHFDDASGIEGPMNLASLRQPSAEARLYVCGPAGFIDAVTQAAQRNGWPKDQIHVEHFGTDSTVFPAHDLPFEIQVASTGQTFDVRPNETVAQVLMRNGFDLPVSCEQGVCGSCLTGVLEGDPDHRDVFLTPEQQACNDNFMPCCSRSIGPRLVLDL